jgi:hypothetical protein
MKILTNDSFMFYLYTVTKYRREADAWNTVLSSMSLGILMSIITSNSKNSLKVAVSTKIIENPH